MHSLVFYTKSIHNHTLCISAKYACIHVGNYLSTYCTSFFKVSHTVIKPNNIIHDKAKLYLKLFTALRIHMQHKPTGTTHDNIQYICLHRTNERLRLGWISSYSCRSNISSIHMFTYPIKTRANMCLKMMVNCSFTQVCTAQVFQSGCTQLRNCESWALHTRSHPWTFYDTSEN